jgi:hypothetical protein
MVMISATVERSRSELLDAGVELAHEEGKPTVSPVRIGRPATARSAGSTITWAIEEMTSLANFGKECTYHA